MFGARLAAPAAYAATAAASASCIARRSAPAAAARARSMAAAVSSSAVVRAPSLTKATLNPAVVAAAYAVRGELVMKADRLREALAAGEKQPFEQIVACNIGNPHELGQAPITFFRQVLALCHYPALLTEPRAQDLFAADAIARAKEYLGTIAGTGAYTTSQGIKAVRSEVAAFLERRDGHKASSDDVFLTDGASAGVKMILNLLVRGAKDGVMTPLPQYPLYSASMTLFGGSLAPYELDESRAWGLTRAELERSYDSAVAAGVQPRALVIINPGNPTGQVLDRDVMETVVTFAAERNLVLMADEVYQSNVYAKGKEFHSFKRVVRDMRSDVALVSFHSVSKGFLGECGQRGGFFELVNFPAEAKEQLVKLASISLCSNVSGQLMTGLMVNPPAKGAPSYATYVQERDSILASLARRAHRVSAELNECTGVTCNEVEGALYAFAQIVLPAKAVTAAQAAGKVPDAFYSLALLDATGICVVPGSGFGQKAGTWHFRTTILPSEQAMDGVLTRFKKFNEDFMQKYA